MQTYYNILLSVFENEIKQVREIISEKTSFLSSHKIDNKIFSEGKLLRPILCFALANEKLSEKNINFAAALEIIHNASLIHDDLLDRSQTRRSARSMPEKEGINKSLLCGDMLLASAIELCYEKCGHTEASILVSTVKTMCSGELLQENVRFEETKSAEMYLDIIRNKTASLFKAAAKGVVPGNEDAKIIAELCGMAFQINNDITDVLQDTKSGIYTIPKILAGKINPSASHRRKAAQIALEMLDEAEDIAIKNDNKNITTFIRTIQEMLICNHGS